MIPAECSFLLMLLTALTVLDEPPATRPLPQGWEYAPAIRRVADRFAGRAGVVLHIGDSITYSNPYGQWARMGRGKSEEDKATLAWMHSGSDDDSDGWWLARFDHPDGGRSHTAAGGLRIDELLAGGKSHLPSLEQMLMAYRPQAVVLMIGTNDAARGRPLGEFRRDFERCVDLILAQGVVCIASTLPPQPPLAREYNAAIRDTARSRSLPLIDFEREILSRRRDDWNGTLLGRDDVHPTVEREGVSPASEPTAENLRRSGYLLRGWLTVQKVSEVKKAVFDLRPSSASPAPLTLPAGEIVRLPITRDIWFSEVGPEGDGNNGGSNKLKVKSYQEMSLLDIDPAPLKGRVVLGAELHVKLAAEPILKRMTVGTFGADWTEGTGASYEHQRGSSTFRSARHPDLAWTPDGGDLCRVMLGQGNTLWWMADASPPDSERRQTIAVDPLVVSARIAGTSRGFLLFDDTGSEWTRNGEEYKSIHMPNRFINSREAGPKDAPYLIVSLGAEDRSPPPVPTEIQVETSSLPAGDAKVSWLTPKDTGVAGTAGFLVNLDQKPVPDALVPKAGRAGERVSMRLRDLGISPGEVVLLSIRAVDRAGNVGIAAESRIRVSSRVPAELPRKIPYVAAPANVPLPEVDGVEVAVIDELDKIQLATGELIPSQPKGYLASNHIWSARNRQVKLHAARGESIAFQIALRGHGCRPYLAFGGSASNKLRAEFGRYEPVETRNGPIPDPIVPLAESDEGKSSKLMYECLHAEIVVPQDCPSGTHEGILTLQHGGQRLPIRVTLRVWDFTLPDFLSFLPEMNCYGLPENERDYYRLAHRHRTVLNRVPYSQRGDLAPGCAPGWDGKALSWAEYDRRFGPYLDGSAFSDLPRKSVPIECFYLPIHENWPTEIAPNYNGDYWADRAFKPSYRRDFVEVSRQFAAHLNGNGWDETLFHCFFNGKNDFKKNGWSRGSSPWLLDEPASFQDFWALRYFGLAFHEGVRQAGAGRAKLVFRADVSRPQWQRDSLDGLLDYNVVSSAMRPYHRIVFDRKEAEGQVVVEYGSANPIEESNTQAVGWSLDSWSLGSDGVLPWQTVGRDESWKQADTLSLFYPGRNGRGPVPSIRLKAFRRGQQDVEYLTLLCLQTSEPRGAVGEQVRKLLGLVAERGASGTAGGAEDAGLMRYKRLRPQDLWAFRVRIGEALSSLHPAPRRKLVELRTPPRDPSRIERRDVVFGNPGTR